MKVRVVVDLEVGRWPVADAITYFVARNGLAVSDDSRSVTEWVEAVIVDSIERSLDEQYSSGCDRWLLITSAVSESL